MEEKYLPSLSLIIYLEKLMQRQEVFSIISALKVKLAFGITESYIKIPNFEVTLSTTE